MHRTIVRRAAAMGFALVLIVAGAVPAAAHPFLRVGRELPVDTSVTITLDLAHGCATEGTGADADTLEVALEVPEWLDIIEILDVPGYEHAVESEDDRIVAIVWAESGDPVPAPRFDLEVIASGQPGDTRYLSVFQACEDSSYRWVGTPDAPTDHPAVRVQLVDEDADVSDDHDHDHSHDHEHDHSHDHEHSHGDEDDATPTDGDDEGAVAISAVESDESGASPLPWILAGVIALAGALVLIVRRSMAKRETDHPASGSTA